MTSIKRSISLPAKEQDSIPQIDCWRGWTAQHKAVLYKSRKPACWSKRRFNPNTSSMKDIYLEESVMPYCTRADNF